MLDKNLVTISEYNNPANSFVFHADPESFSYDIVINHTNIDTVRASETYTHIRSRVTQAEISLIFIETDKVTIDDCHKFFESLTEISDKPYPAINLYYEDKELIQKLFLITKVTFSYMDYLPYVTGAKPRRATVELSLQAFQSNFLKGDTANDIKFIQ
jgi:hypothetical protein